MLRTNSRNQSFVLARAFPIRLPTRKVSGLAAALRTEKSGLCASDKRCGVAGGIDGIGASPRPSSALGSSRFSSRRSAAPCSGQDHDADLKPGLAASVNGREWGNIDPFSQNYGHKNYLEELLQTVIRAVGGSHAPISTGLYVSPRRRDESHWTCLASLAMPLSKRNTS